MEQLILNTPALCVALLTCDVPRVHSGTRHCFSRNGCKRHGGFLPTHVFPKDGTVKRLTWWKHKATEIHVVPVICIHGRGLQDAKSNRKAQSVQCWEWENNQQEICFMWNLLSELFLIYLCLTLPVWDMRWQRRPRVKSGAVSAT